MYPYIEFLGKQLSSYMLMALIGALCAGIVAYLFTKKRGRNENDMIIVLLVAAVGVLIGGPILYAITHIKAVPLIFRVRNFSELVTMLAYIFGGSVFYGGLIGGSVAALLTIKIKKLELPIYADIIAVVIPLFHAFARVGCFLGGCCYGIESEFGFTAHNNPLVESVNGVSRFPVQLLESSLNLVIFAVLLLLYKKTLSGGFLNGKLLFVYLILYSAVRFCDEFLRGDAIRGFVLGVSTSQFISIILFAVSVTVLCVFAVKGKNKPQNE